ncbi:DUF4148 domain-containing protein [Caballeronia sp. ATUFL_M2_KS44]|uniref:DUF4148 domain-containing protein n=1 Tax=Caballeronia sp. ATUFL_M2_KS44 TaxID=2921767 RepID=UPI0020280A94|nr:DUF4148 domain-containing protein [Caballeronia sp. ATUFL_M2_KS44]
MNTIAKVVVSVAVVIAPTFVFAQTDSAPVTRAQVRAELVQLERAGYSAASGDNASYPVDIQAAEAKVAAQQNADGANQSYGGTRSGATGSGMTQRGSSSASDCVGPAGFCVPYFGN